MYEDADGFTAEFMLQHGRPLEEVYGFIIARDEVRRIEVPLAVREDFDMAVMLTMRCKAAA